MWIPIVIIVLAVALAIGPVLWLSPSPRDKRLSACRAQAARRGMRVELRRREQLGSSPAVDRELEEVAFYRLPWDATDPVERPLAREAQWEWSLVRFKFSHELHFAGQWHWLDGGRVADANPPALREFVERLPESVVACECRRSGVALAWLERGNASHVDELWLLLKELKQLAVAEVNALRRVAGEPPSPPTATSPSQGGSSTP